MAENRVLLDENLDPMWKWLHCSGFVSVYCFEQRLPIRIGRYICNILITLLCVIFALFELRHFVNQVLLSHEKNFGLFFSLLWFSPFPVYYVTQHQFLSHQNQIAEFLLDWKKVENRSLSVRNAVKTTTLYPIYALQILMVMITTFCWSYLMPIEPYLLTSIGFLRETMGIFSLSLITAVVYYFLILIHISSQLVPSLFFYHAGRVIESLERELQHRYSLHLIPHFILEGSTAQMYISRPASRVWEEYEVVFDMVSRANRLFGIVIILSDFTLFVYICLLLYGIIKFSQTALFMSGILTLTVFPYTFQLVFSNWLTSHLYLSSSQLQSTVSRLLSKKWKFLAEDDRNVLNSFQNRLGRFDMAAQPLNLYTVTPANLLSMLTLGVSYVIILLQSPV